MSPATPRVSVLMPVYNGERYLRAAIESILGQTFTDLELVAVDDGSADDSRAIIAAAAQRDRRVRPMFLPHQGLVRTLNAGLAGARGAWVARMDADDVSLPDRLEAQLAFAERHPGVGIVGTYARYLGEHGRVMGLYRLGPTTMEEFDSLIRQGRLVHLLHPTVLMDRRVVSDAGGYDPTFRHVEDLELYNRLAARGIPSLALPEAKLLYRVHRDSVAMRSHREMFRMARYTQVVMQARRQGRPPASLAAFLEVERSEGWWRRAATTRADWGAFAYRRAGVELASGSWMRGAAWLALSCGLAPLYALRKVRSQVSGG